MKYFNTLPQIIQTDSAGNQVVATNLVARSFFLPSLANNLDVMYRYDIKDGDTPENIAYRYYGSVDRFWIVLMANNIMDAQWEWPLDTNQFSEFILSKYSSHVNSTDSSIVFAYVQSTVHHYEQDITTYNDQDDHKQTITVIVDKNTFDHSTDSSATFQINGVSTTRQTTYRAASLYDYEVSKNEANRRIYILRDTYVGMAESQLKSLMA